MSEPTTMTDPDAVLFLIGIFGRQSDLARQMGVTPQVVHNWRRRGRISPEKRPLIWTMVNANGGSLPTGWLLLFDHVGKPKE